MAVSVSAGDSEIIEVETNLSEDSANYFNMKINRAKKTEAVQKSGPAGKMLYILVGVSFGLMCVLQVTLNISLHLAHSNFLEEQIKWLETSYNNLTEEKKQLQISYNNLTEEKKQLQTSYNNLTEEKKHLQISYNNLTKERDKFTELVTVCPIVATPVRTWDRRRLRAMPPRKHNPAKPHCFLTHCSLKHTARLTRKPAAPMCWRKHCTTCDRSQRACARPATGSH
ncbi:uncharacterized protein LOC109893774 isoform X1 [Oncorhynchus kisutch]|uniref:uncharacterized protein LOC109893774 isoform X1 n=1 Tax=Oncorhynchus kisutch TaxID=8019 RepID=UPI0012DCA8FB|nr:uncharacterized protein LOC109893774 isoform X1 [Oncorhynchus kisutch]